MAMQDVGVVLAHGAWADGSSWTRVISALTAQGVKVKAAALPLTSLADDVRRSSAASSACRGR
jgi:predicted alpha/beta-hydrolase family hydrolase